MSSSRNLLQDLVARGVDDWIYDAELLDIAKQHGAEDPHDRRTVALGLLAEVLLGGLMEAGSVTDDGFAAWTCSPAESVERAAELWLSRSDPLVMPGEILWLSTTQSGSALGAAVLMEERG